MSVRAPIPPGDPRHDALWVAAQERQRFTAHDLSARLSIHVDRVRPTLNQWVREGALVDTGDKSHQRRVYAVTGRRPVEHGAGQSVGANLWRAARLLKQFSAPLLAAHAATPEQPVSEEEAHAFCRMLLRAGYSAVVQTAVPGVRSAAYRLVRDTGPQPPQERRIVAVWDANECAWAHVPEPRA